MTNEDETRLLAYDAALPLLLRVLVNMKEKLDAERVNTNRCGLAAVVGDVRNL